MQSSDRQDGQEDAGATNTGWPPVHPASSAQSSPPPLPHKCQHLQIPSFLARLSHETKGWLFFPMSYFQEAVTLNLLPFLLVSS